MSLNETLRKKANKWMDEDGENCRSFAIPVLPALHTFVIFNRKNILHLVMTLLTMYHIKIHWR